MDYETSIIFQIHNMALSELVQIMKEMVVEIGEQADTITRLKWRIERLEATV